MMTGGDFTRGSRCPLRIGSYPGREGGERAVFLGVSISKRGLTVP